MIFSIYKFFKLDLIKKIRKVHTESNIVVHPVYHE